MSRIAARQHGLVTRTDLGRPVALTSALLRLPVARGHPDLEAENPHMVRSCSHARGKASEVGGKASHLRVSSHADARPVGGKR
jgi:hypothetical protein